jgi:hypothetical protein
MSESLIELDTDDVTEAEIDEIHRLADTCNGQAFNFMASSDNDIVVKDALIEGSGIGHCFIYDRDRDVTIDACMRQFSVGPEVGAWDGDEHPYAQPHEEVRVWESEDEFKSFYDDAPENDFIY